MYEFAHTCTHTHTPLPFKNGFILVMRWWGPTFSSWPCNYSCCYGKTGDTPPLTICYHGNREGEHTMHVYCVFFIILCRNTELYAMNSSLWQHQEFIYTLTRAKQADLCITAQWWILHPGCKLLNKDLLIGLPFTVCQTIQERWSVSALATLLPWGDMTWMVMGCYLKESQKLRLLV